MKSARKILLFLALLIGQICYAYPSNKNQTINSYNALSDYDLDDNNMSDDGSEFDDNDDSDNSAMSTKITADSLTRESLITPEMVEAVVLAGSDIASLHIDKATGKIFNLPSVDTVLDNLSTHESAKKTLHTLLEATEIALFVENLSKKYDGLDFNADNNLKADLEQQKKDIQTQLNLISKQQSFYSWIFGSETTNHAQHKNEKIKIDSNPAFIEIPVKYLPAIAHYNNYKQKQSAQHGAELLFKQAFIAQQYRFPNPVALKINGTHIMAEQYIYHSFPKFHDLCKSILDLNDKSQKRSRLLQTRQAVQTALFLANRMSAANIDYIIPKRLIPYLDGVVSELLQYANHINSLCLQPRYGATPLDIEQAPEWSTFEKVVAGVAIAGAVVGVALTYDKISGSNNVGNAYNYTKDTANAGYNKASQKATDVSNWWNTPAAPATPAAADNNAAPSADNAEVAKTEENKTDELNNASDNQSKPAAAPEKAENGAPAVPANNARQDLIKQAETELAAAKTKFKYNSDPNIIKAEERLSALQNTRNDAEASKIAADLKMATPAIAPSKANSDVLAAVETPEAPASDSQGKIVATSADKNASPKQSPAKPATPVKVKQSPEEIYAAAQAQAKAKGTSIAKLEFEAKKSLEDVEKNSRNALEIQRKAAEEDTTKKSLVEKQDQLLHDKDIELGRIQSEITAAERRGGEIKTGYFVKKSAEDVRLESLTNQAATIADEIKNIHQAKETYNKEYQEAHEKLIDIAGTVADNPQLINQKRNELLALKTATSYEAHQARMNIQKNHAQFTQAQRSSNLESLKLQQASELQAKQLAAQELRDNKISEEEFKNLEAEHSNNMKEFEKTIALLQGEQPQEKPGFVSNIINSFSSKNNPESPAKQLQEQQLAEENRLAQNHELILEQRKNALFKDYYEIKPEEKAAYEARQKRLTPAQQQNKPANQSKIVATSALSPDTSTITQLFKDKVQNLKNTIDNPDLSYEEEFARTEALNTPAPAPQRTASQQILFDKQQAKQQAQLQAAADNYIPGLV